MALLSGEMRTLVQNFVHDYKARVEAVADLRTNVKLELNNYRTAQQALSAEQEKALDKHKEALRREVAYFLKDTDAAHRSMATAQEQSLVEGRNQLNAEVTATREKLRSEQNAMATAQEQSLVEGRNQLNAEVTATREELHTDQAEAAKIWANISQLKQKNRMTLDVAPRVKKGSATSSQAAESAWRMASPAEPVDDLKVIHGIGSGMAKHLNDAGISSFAQLAASTPEQLRQVLGKGGKLAKVETWITQAQDLIQ